MGTIKTTGTGSALRILTKTVSGVQRVSCSCCEEPSVCCMYPAYEYDAISDAGLIKHEDLPDVMFRGDLQFNKINPVFLDELRYGIYLDPTSPNEENEGYIYWNTDGGDFGPIWSAFAEGGQNCLVDDLEGFQRDDFADNYTADWGFTTREPERTSLCTWFDGSFVLVYTTPESIDSFDGEYTGPLYKWVAQGRFLQPDEGGGFWVKDDPQNSPEGTYQGISGQTLGFETFTIPEP